MAFQSHMPSNFTLYDVTRAPYNAENSKNHGGGSDCTKAIQKALNDASSNGGGIIFSSFRTLQNGWNNSYSIKRGA